MKKGVSLKQMKVMEKIKMKGSFWWIVLEGEEEFEFRTGQYVSVKVSEKGERREKGTGGYRPHCERDYIPIGTEGVDSIQ